MPRMTDAQRDAFVAERRYGVLTTLRADGSPISVPVWFEWDGTNVQMFTHSSTPKLRRLRRDPRASLLVVNEPGEPEDWVAFDGRVTVHDEGGLELALRLADRYWPEPDPRRKALNPWRQMETEWRRLELKPAAIRVHDEE